MLVVFLFIGCKNPFAPKEVFSNDNNSQTLPDLKTIEGLFTNFQYAYTFQDTSIYSKLISNNFIFTFRDYDKGFDITWGRDDELKTTNGLFTNTQRLDLIWNNIVLSNIDTLNAIIVRSFNLTITFNPLDVIRIDGRVNLQLRKELITNNWQIIKWEDESSF